MCRIMKIFRFIKLLFVDPSILGKYLKLYLKMIIKHFKIHIYLFRKGSILKKPLLMEKSLKEILKNHKNLNFHEKSGIIKNFVDEDLIYKNQILICCNEILENKFEIFNNKYEFKDKINWHYSFYKDQNWPVDLSDTIPLYGLGIDVDIKYNWELNRFGFINTLALGYVISGDERYAKKVFELILNWIDENPINFGVNWYSGLEISIRVSNWILSLKLLLNYSNYTIFNTKIILESILDHYYLLKIKFEKDNWNHSLGEALGLYFISQIFITNKHFQRDNKKYEKYIIKQLVRQFQKDGVNIEQSSNYHRFTAEMLLLFYCLAPKKLSNLELSILKKIFEYLLYLKTPNNIPLNIGDNDDGSFIPRIFFSGYRTDGLISCGFSKLFSQKHSIIKKIQSKCLLEVFTKKFDQNLTNQMIKIENTKFFSNAGYFFARTGWESNSSFVFFDMGNYKPPNGAHDHADVSNIIYFYRGQPILVDSGVYRYNISLIERHIERSPQNHNVLQIDNLDQSNQISYFSCKNLPEVKRTYKKENGTIYCNVSHNGFKKFLVKRMLKIKDGLNIIEIEDSVIQKLKINYDSITISIRFHFHPQVKIKMDLTDSITLNENLKMEIVNPTIPFNVKLKEYYYSEKYGERRIAKFVEFLFTLNNLSYNDWKFNNIIRISSKN